MQKSKKQKHQQQMRAQLTTIFTLDPQLCSYFQNKNINQNLLTKTYRYIHGVNCLRIFTLIEINYIIRSLFDVLQKSKANKDLKIGIIGGGIMGRLILNTILIFTKQGLNPENILISTRQYHHLESYITNFSVRTCFDNQKVANECDIIFVTTPATLDNWIITQLKKNLDKRLKLYQVELSKTSYNTTMSLKTQIKSKSSTIELPKSSTQYLPSLTKTQKQQKQQSFIRPFVYILTSDIEEQKCKRLFDFPVVVPWVRATEIEQLITKVKELSNQHNTSQFNVQSLIKLFQQVMIDKIFAKIHIKDPNSELDEEQQNITDSQRLTQIIQVLEFCFIKITQNWRKQNTINVQKKPTTTKTLIEKNEKSLIKQVLTSQDSYAQTFSTKCRKWKMAYNNFIS